MHTTQCAVEYGTLQKLVTACGNMLASSTIILLSFEHMNADTLCIVHITLSSSCIQLQRCHTSLTLLALTCTALLSATLVLLLLLLLLAS